MGEPLPVVADIPTEHPGLGFPEYVEAIADAVRGGQPAQFTIGIYGPWGTGKSSILRALERHLAGEDDVTPVFFDAWRYEQSEHIIVPLLHETYHALRRSGRSDVAASPARPARGRRRIELQAAEGPRRAGGVGRAGSRAAGRGVLAAVRRAPRAARDARRARIAVLIDDLDRCSDRNVVALLEAINLVMDVPGLIFVLALDYEVLVNAIERKYEHVNGHTFIEKLVQIPFRVPPLSIDNRRSLEELLPDWERHAGELPDHFYDRIVDIALLGLRGNPRQVKRLLNSFLMLRRIMQRRNLPVDELLLAALIGLQLRWPAEHQRFHDAVRDAMHGDGADPLSAIGGRARRRGRLPGSLRRRDRRRRPSRCGARCSSRRWSRRRASLNPSPFALLGGPERGRGFSSRSRRWPLGAGGRGGATGGGRRHPRAVARR